MIATAPVPPAVLSCVGARPFASRRRTIFPIYRFADSRLHPALSVSVCCSERVLRLRQAQEEAEKTIRDLKEANKAAFARELAQKDQGEQGFTADLKRRQAEESAAIDAGFNKNKAEVIDLLLRHVTTVELEVGEALRQSLLTKAEVRDTHSHSHTSGIDGMRRRDIGGG